MPYFGVPIRNGVPIGLRSTAGFGIPPFDPSQLFVNGEQGGWYDPSDLTTMFQDAVAATAAALEQPVGLVLDKSRGLVPGSELTTNGNFSNGTTGWSAGNGATLSTSGGELVVTASPAWGSATQSLTLVAGRSYWVSVTMRRGTASNAQLILAGTTILTTSTVNVTFTRLITPSVASNTLQLYCDAASGGTAFFDNVSVQELPGNHLFQSTPGARPVLSAKVNLLERTEDFSNAYWSNYKIRPWGSGSTVNATTAPDGTLTADLAVEDNTTDAHVPFFRLSVPAGSYTYTISSKAYSGSLSPRYLVLRVYITLNNWLYYTFDLASSSVDAKSGTLSSFTGVTASNTDSGDGWRRCTLTFTAPSTIVAIGGHIVNSASPSPDTNGNTPYTGDNTSGLYIWGADLRFSNAGVGLPAYQRVGAATDYNATGFPYYLKFDGTDDSLSSSSIDFTSTDNMSAFAGARKLSDASAAMLVELSADFASNAGSFFLTQGDYTTGLGARWQYAQRGSAAAGTSLSAQSPANFAAPITNVLSGYGDISADTCIVRVNGAQQASTTADQGSGNFGNYPLYVGRRGGSAQPFNGYLYSLIVRGAPTDEGMIYATETWVNQKTMAY